jgi:hypothetical protein
MLAVLTGTIAFIVSRLAGWHFAFVWYITATLATVAMLLVWAAVELWKDYGPRRN